MAVEKTVQFDAQERDLLKSVPLLAGLPDPVLSGFIDGQGPIGLERGTVLFHQGQSAHQMFVVLKGWIRLFRIGEAGAEAVIRIAGRGEVVGETGLLLPQGHSESAEAVSPVRVLSIDGSKFSHLMRRDPAMGIRLASSLAQHVHVMAKHIEVMKLLDAQQRTAHFLLGLSGVRSGACSLTLPFEKSIIAGWLGMKPASFSRALFRLRMHGVIVDRDVVTVSDAQRLVQLAAVPVERMF